MFKTLFIGFEFEFYCFDTFFKPISSIFVDLLNSKINLRILGVLKHEKGYGQLEFASQVFEISSQMDNVIDDSIIVLKNIIINFCNENNLQCFFSPMPYFVRHQKFSTKIDYNLPLLASSLQISVSHPQVQYGIFVNAFMYFLHNNFIDKTFNTTPTQACVKRLQFYKQLACPIEYKLSTPSKICWGYKDNRTTAIRVIKNLQHFTSYRVELRVLSTLSKTAKIIRFLFNCDCLPQNFPPPLFANAFEHDHLPSLIAK